MHISKRVLPSLLLWVLTTGVSVSVSAIPIDSGFRHPDTGSLDSVHEPDMGPGGDSMNLDSVRVILAGKDETIQQALTRREQVQKYLNADKPQKAKLRFDFKWKEKAAVLKALDFESNNHHNRPRVPLTIHNRASLFLSNLFGIQTSVSFGPESVWDPEDDLTDEFRIICRLPLSLSEERKEDDGERGEKDGDVAGRGGKEVSKTRVSGKTEYAWFKYEIPSEDRIAQDAPLPASPESVDDGHDEGEISESETQSNAADDKVSSKEVSGKQVFGSSSPAKGPGELQKGDSNFSREPEWERSWDRADLYRPQYGEKGRKKGKYKDLHPPSFLKSLPDPYVIPKAHSDSN
ncbi:hypothetical protein F5878DRAFT_656910 [Lentinula raphanica]|uniref:Uncharacterized protein n=1 Tax=Lentinula raphanica TaxID=153919 RepID=A0AA38PIB5_9AGAR|nr:hypothetical protein F5878DRAFT_656910 [Lentinula raphanica]